jgi:hypothetical protein
MDPSTGNLAYESRDDCQAREFGIEICWGLVSNSPHPKIDRDPYQ